MTAPAFKLNEAERKEAHIRKLSKRLGKKERREQFIHSHLSNLQAEKDKIK